ncbi:hypothetical protein [Halocatena halophila]|uniref:hypothetical protein n=1 Tax=Halocatena halophila TaxID=2814576 RepID=UPI002ED06E16
MSDTVNEVIEELDRMQKMNLAAARGIFNESELERAMYTTENGELKITVLIAGSGIMVATDGQPNDMAWASHEADIKIINDLVESGHLTQVVDE